jgi:crossover junction endodeoxyribonuclease RuvC
MKYLLGFDPGTNGAICLYRPDDIVMFDMPTLDITRNGKKRQQIDLYELGRFIDKHSADIQEAFIENPQGMPGMASNATYRLGLNVGIAQMAVASAFIPMTLIAPATWKKSMGLSSDKDASRLKASQLFPQWSHHWSRVKDSDRAEALLIAIYGKSLTDKTQ